MSLPPDQTETNSIASPPPRRQPSLRAQMASGILWSGGAFGVNQCLRLASNVVLAWLLFPEAFGLMAMVGVVTSGLDLFSNVGLRSSVVQNARGDDPAFLNNVFTLKIIRGLLLWSAAWLLAHPVAIGYGEPRLAELIPVAAAASILTGCRSTKLIWHQRHLRYRHNVGVELATRSVGLGATLWLAWHWRDVWALPFGHVTGAAVGMLLSHLAVPGPGNRLAWHSATIIEVLRFGKWLYVSNVLTFFSNHADKLLMAALVPWGVLGVYSIGAGLAQMPSSLISRVNVSVLFPAFAKHHRAEPHTLRQKVHLTRRTVLLTAVFILLAMLLLAPLFFHTFYESAYHAAGWMAQLVCIAVWIESLKGMSQRALLARGVTWVFAASNAANAAGKVVGCLGGYYLLGLPGFILGFAFGTLCGYLAVQWAMVRERMSMLSQDVKFTALLVALVVIGRAAQILAAEWGPAAVPETLMELAAAAVVLGMYGVWAGHTILTTLFGPGWDGLWWRVEQVSGGRLTWALPRRFRSSSSSAR